MFHKIDVLFVVSELALVAKGVKEYKEGVDGVFLFLMKVLELIACLLHNSVVLEGLSRVLNSSQVGQLAEASVIFSSIICFAHGPALPPLICDKTAMVCTF